MEDTVTAERLREELKAPRLEISRAQEKLDAARALLAPYVADSAPVEVCNQAVIAVAQNLYQRGQAALERAQLGDGSESAPYAFRPALDPLTPARPLLAPWWKEVGIL